MRFVTPKSMMRDATSTRREAVAALGPSGPTLTRREALAALGLAAALPWVGGCESEQGGAVLMTIAEDDALRLLDELAEHLLVLMPESATSLGIDTGARSALRSRLGDRSPAGQTRIADTLRTDLARVEALDVSGLPYATRTSFEVVRSAYATALAGYALPYGDVAVGGWRNSPYVVIQNLGAYLDVPRFLDSDHRIAGAEDAEAYLARLEAFPEVLDGELARMQAAHAAGLVPPAFLIDRALDQLRLTAERARGGGPLVTSLERRTGTIPGTWGQRALTIVQRDVAAALERQIAEFEAQRSQSTDEAGMWARPDGDAYYAWALRAATSTSLTPDEVHKMGLSELEGLHAQMDEILKSVGYAQGTVGERMQALAEDPRYQFADGDAGRAEIMAFIENRLAWIRAQLPRAFGTLVSPNMEVRRLPPEEEPGAPGAYGGAGSIDGTIPGRFWINLRDTSLHSRYSLADLTFHESIPGHIWQGEFTRGTPLIRQMLAFNAYSEGWALYAEQLADELGAYDQDPVGRLGYLQSISFRSCRLVVDTGLHAKRWTRDEAVRYFVEVNGSNPLEVASEVDRYCSWPGQACGYEVGHREINRHRERARSALGPRFDLKAFNDAVVRGGNVPLDVLAKNIDEYLS